MPVLVGLLLIFSVGVLFGLLFIVAMISVYSTYFKKKIYRRLIERTKRYITSGYENCDGLWNFGGLVFVNAENKKLGCVSPEGDWKDCCLEFFGIYDRAQRIREKRRNAR